MDHSYTTDTSSEAYTVQLELLRQMSPMDRLRKTFSLSRRIKQMSMDAIRRRHPDYDDNEIRLRFIELTYGRELADGLRHWQKEQMVG